MTAANENPLIPASLATDGNQGADAKTLGPCEAQDNARALSAHYLARVAVQAAKAQLDRYALATDAPEAGMVEAADLLDAAGVLLAQAVTP